MTDAIERAARVAVAALEPGEPERAAHVGAWFAAVVMPALVPALDDRTKMNIRCCVRAELRQSSTNTKGALPMRTTIHDALVELEDVWKLPKTEAIRLAGLLVMAGILSSEARRDEAGTQRRVNETMPDDPPAHELLSIVREVEGTA